MSEFRGTETTGSRSRFRPDLTRLSKLQASLLIALVGIALGFGATMLLLPAGPLPGPVSWSVRFHGGVIYPNSLDTGWGLPTREGVPLVERRGVLQVELPRPARDEQLQLVVEVKSARSAHSGRGGIAVSLGGTSLGTWRLVDSEEPQKTRFIVPASVVRGRDTFAIELAGGEETARSGRPRVLLRSAQLRDISDLRDYRGFVGGCTKKEVRGWAAADRLPVPVRLSIDEKAVTWIRPSLARKDLAEKGLPLHAGYRHRFSEPLAKGQSVSVRFPNGVHLNHSPCRVGE